MNRKALVVGAAGGVGLAVTRQLAAEGWSVAATVLDAAEAAVLGQAVPSARATQLDLGKADAVGSTLAPLLDGVSAVVVCAAMAPVGPLETTPIATVRKTLEINALSAVAIYQAAMPALRHSKGRLVFLSSFLGKVALPFVGSYAGSKHALEGYGDVMRREAAPFGVDVVLIEPGGIRTPMVRGQINSLEHERAALSAGSRALYDGLFDTYTKVLNAALAGGLEPAAVAQVVATALNAERPRARYVVGDDAMFICNSVARMPDQEQDLTVAGFLAQMSGN
jgi:NAD(P)-dependent dehydrogenase (short-subunit alcohol dehydrogenase family)